MVATKRLPVALGALLLAVQAAGTAAWADPPTRPLQGSVPSAVASVMPAPARVMPAPYGLDHGTCDRGTLTKDISAGMPRAAVGGGVLGALIGAEIGRTMDEADQVCVAQTLEYAPDRMRVVWAARDGEELTIAPESTFEREGGWCRTYRATAERDGRRTTTIGTACRGPDGLWRATG
jgi:surface antigen